jgi:nucleoside-diphosphate kinase
MKLASPTQEHLEKHYADLAGKPFFKGLVACELPPLRGFR